MNDEIINTWDKLISALSYLTGGFVGVIWLITATIAKKSVSKFLLFNIWQSIFLSILGYILSMLTAMLVSILILIPIINVLTNIIYSVLNTPIFYHLSVLGFIIFVIYIYMILCSLFGKLAYIPWVSKIILYQVNRY